MSPSSGACLLSGTHKVAKIFLVLGRIDCLICQPLLNARANVHIALTLPAIGGGRAPAQRRPDAPGRHPPGNTRVIWVSTPSNQTKIVVVLSLALVIGGIGNGAGLAISALLIQDISGSQRWAGLAVVALTLGAAIFTVPFSRIAARHGRRISLTTGWSMGATGATVTVLAAQWSSLAAAMGGLALFGASSAAALQSRFAAADRADSDRVGRSISIVVWSSTVGAVTGPNLSGPGETVATVIGIPPLAGPMLFASIAFAAAGAVTWVFLRPDPLDTTNRAETPRKAGLVDAVSPHTSTSNRLVDALPFIRGRAALAIATVGISHAVMVAVMALTPVHMQGHGASLQFIGFTISLHIAGMYALSPIMGWLSDRKGSGFTIVLGQLTLIASTCVAGTAGDSHLRITIGLTLLGIGWSASVIAGAALLTTSTEPAVRPLLQGVSDLTMNLSGAAGGLAAGLVVAAAGFGALNAAAAALTIPVVVAVLWAQQRVPVADQPTS